MFTYFCFVVVGESGGESVYPESTVMCLDLDSGSSKEMLGSLLKHWTHLNSAVYYACSKV